MTNCLFIGYWKEWHELRHSVLNYATIAEIRNPIPRYPRQSMCGQAQIGPQEGDRASQPATISPGTDLGAVCVIGYGNQGAAHAQNLRDSGVATTVSGRHGSVATATARRDGFDVISIQEAAQSSALVILAIPEAAHAAVWESVEPWLSPNAHVGFLHGASHHFGVVRRTESASFILVAPKGPGATLRERFLRGLGIPALLAAEAPPDRLSEAWRVARQWATAIGCARAGLIESSFRDEAVADIFGEQAILCGGLVALMKSSYETLIEAGVAPQVAYIECIQELKQIGDLVYERGIAGMRAAISDTAEAGIEQAQEHLPIEEIRSGMGRLLAAVQSGQFFRDHLLDAVAGSPALLTARHAQAASALEATGASVRTMYLPRPMAHPVKEPAST